MVNRPLPSTGGRVNVTRKNRGGNLWVTIKNLFEEMGEKEIFLELVSKVTEVRKGINLVSSHFVLVRMGKVVSAKLTCSLTLPTDGDNRAVCYFPLPPRLRHKGQNGPPTPAPDQSNSH